MEYKPVVSHPGFEYVPLPKKRGYAGVILSLICSIIAIFPAILLGIISYKPRDPRLNSDTLIYDLPTDSNNLSIVFFYYEMLPIWAISVLLSITTLIVSLVKKERFGILRTVTIGILLLSLPAYFIAPYTSDTTSQDDINKHNAQIYDSREKAQGFETIVWKGEDQWLVRITDVKSVPWTELSDDDRQYVRNQLRKETGIALGYYPRYTYDLKYIGPAETGELAEVGRGVNLEITGNCALATIANVSLKQGQTQTGTALSPRPRGQYCEYNTMTAR